MCVLVNVKPDITFKQTGAIEVSSRITSILGIKDGDYINISNDNNEYVVYKSSYGVKMRKTNKTYSKHGFMRGYNKPLCRHFLNDEPIAKYRVGDTTTINSNKAIFIITGKNYAKRY